MTDDILNDGSEEEKKSSDDQFGDDFGLPDLEFDELQELDLGFDGDSLAEEGEDAINTPSLPEEPSTEFDMGMLESSVPDLSREIDLDPPKGTILEEGIDEVEDVLDSAQLISDRLGDDLDSGVSVSDSLPAPEPEVDLDALMNDFAEESGGSDESILSEGTQGDTITDSGLDDLFGDIDSPDDLAALGFADEDENPVEHSPVVEESVPELSLGEPEPELETGGSLFASDEDLTANLDSDDEDSIFGSDLSLETEEKTDFEPAPDSSLPPNYKSYEYNESSGGFSKYIIIGVVVIAVAASAMLWFSKNSDDDDKKLAKTEVKKVVPKKKAEEKVDEVVDKPEETTEVPNKEVIVDSPEEQVSTSVVQNTDLDEEGTIIKVSERTSQSYIIIGSFIDEDLAMDYAKTIIKKGNSVKVLQPYGKSKRYRVSIADFSSYGDAASQLESYKGQYGDQIWALKY
ncbi:SPOR domain-containing protein [Reichenbachiella versicolor]|uniref:SPOR domain-containing protein n=1 Tax=Reichenbachiella versicolor TaxID=1821036 RepID=UPI000D6E4CD5|nr:SPOR domain-containing protein [Reichenbachiella versicolor]